MTQALQNQPFAKLKPVTRCTASYVRENEELKEEIKKLADSMLNVIGVVKMVSAPAYKCIHRDFIEKLRKLEEG